ncbi:MAG: Ig-like domain-containing protein, partial [Bacilli bacterium]|nr:Ig-like domain-containing protein [Bacilli bacterium]
IGNTIQINGSVTPNNASNKTLVWHVDDPSKASISNSGLLTPLTPGTVKVYATSAYGATSEPVKSNEITITIAPQDAVNSALIGTWKEEGYPANYFEVSANEAKLKFGDGKEITLPYAMNDDDGYAVFGTFSDKNVAGYFKIKISSSFSNQADYSYNIDIDNKNYKANVYLENGTLTKYIKASSMALSVSKSTIKVGDSAYISAVFSPSGASEEAYKLEVSDTSIIAFIDEEGDEVAKTDLEGGKKSFRAKGDGTVTVTATSESGLTATIDVTIAAPVKVTSISVSLGNDQIAVGGTTKASVTIAPSNADDTGVTWSSSDPSVAAVSSNGTVTGKKAGFCEIIATAKDGSCITGSAMSPFLAKPHPSVGQASSLGKALKPLTRTMATCPSSIPSPLRPNSPSIPRRATSMRPSS